jgi:hypothetical protein
MPAINMDLMTQTHGVTMQPYMRKQAAVMLYTLQPPLIHCETSGLPLTAKPTPTPRINGA